MCNQLHEFLILYRIKGFQRIKYVLLIQKQSTMEVRRVDEVVVILFDFLFKFFIKY